MLFTNENNPPYGTPIGFPCTILIDIKKSSQQSLEPMLFHAHMRRLACMGPPEEVETSLLLLCLFNTSTKVQNKPTKTMEAG
jgi:hypothetical protein